MGARYAPRKQRMQISALVGRSPYRALGAPGFRGGLSIRWTGRPEDTGAGAGPDRSPGPALRLLVRDPDGSMLPITVTLDDAPVEAVVEDDGSVVLSLPDNQPHTLTVRSPDHATLRQLVKSTTDTEQVLERTLPLGGGDGILAVHVRDPKGTPLSTVEVEYTPGLTHRQRNDRATAARRLCARAPGTPSRSTPIRATSSSKPSGATSATSVLMPRTSSGAL